MDERGYLRLADMGLSKVLGVGKDHVRTSTVCGTRAYLAPEMVLRKPYGYSVDFWQFGCFLFELYAVSQSMRPGPGSMLSLGGEAIRILYRIAKRCGSASWRIFSGISDSSRHSYGGIEGLL